MSIVTASIRDFFPENNEWSAGLFIEWPLFTGFARRHRLSRQQAELSAREAEVRRLALEVQEQVWFSFQRLQEAYEALDATRALVEEATESMRLTRERYAAGAVLSITLTFLTHRFAMRPLTALANAVHRVGTGQFGTQVTGPMPSEMRALAERFNWMRISQR